MCLVSSGMLEPIRINAIQYEFGGKYEIYSVVCKILSFIHHLLISISSLK